MKDGYTVIVGDVVKSSSIKDRVKYWKEMQKVVNLINNRYKELLFAPLMILKGDEITGVLRNFKSSYTVAREFQEAFYPYLMRFVCVYGQIDIAIETRNASLMDGQAFWDADKYLEMIKNKKLYFYFDFGNKLIDETLTSMANLIAILKNKWSQKEREIISQYEKFNNQEIVAKKYKISQQSVSNALKRSHWHEIRSSEAIILKVLGSYMGGDKSGIN